MNISDIVSRQNAFFDTNETKSIEFRIEQLKKLKNVLRDNEEQMFEAIYTDFGKSSFETYMTELAFLHGELNIAIRKVKKWSKKKRVRTNLVNMPARSYILPEPLGTALIIGACNYPYQLSLAPAVAAMAAGNTIILKPSEIPSRTSCLMKDIVNSNFPEHYFMVIEGGAQETFELLKLKFDKIFFSGSVPVGKIVYRAAAEHLTPVTLELGGKSPAFVLPDCDIDITAKRLVWGKFLNAGQTCVAPDYILVHSSIEKVLLEALKRYIQEFFGSMDDVRDNYARICNDRNFNRLAELITEAQIYCGGKRDKDKRFIEPTVLTKVGFEDAIMKDEIFGPLLPVIPFDILDESIRQVKSMPKPLSCYVFTKNKASKRKILYEISFGGGCVNDTVVHLINSSLPFGGVGNSGIGNYHGEAGFAAFSHYKSILEKSFRIDIKTRYIPYTRFKMKLIKWFMG